MRGLSIAVGVVVLYRTCRVLLRTRRHCWVLGLVVLSSKSRQPEAASGAVSCDSCVCCCSLSVGILFIAYALQVQYKPYASSDMTNDLSEASVLTPGLRLAYVRDRPRMMRHQCWAECLACTLCAPLDAARSHTL
jgi:hypothetical protein